MTDMNGFNPDKKLGAHFTPGSKQKKQEAPETGTSAAGEPGDPYADLKITPDRMLDLLAAQGKSQHMHARLGGSPSSVERAMDSFMGTISPEGHSLMSRMLEQTFLQEFGKKPSPAMLQEILDNYLVGQPVIQNS
ncbi:hypothetical protein [Vampirovibrio chlorellavorus]|uniref:hypothetical protein n=1 Tax=Vampirovibrio chlorellavorus TaxID=758823 RepID=UPI0026ECDDDF|nr:hypothetical protein [Vampirovibrio chlorellavorus]